MSISGFRDALPPAVNPDARDLWDDLFPARPHARPPGADLMLHLIAYDIAEPKRWQRIVDLCLDHGTRVQYSLFECWLEADQFDRLWERLEAELDLKEDRLVAYVLDTGAARRRRAAGQTMQVTTRAVSYVV